MNGPSALGVLARNRARLAAIVGALALAAILAACANPLSKSPSASNGHACADLVAKAITSTTAVQGSWACLSPELQNTLHAYGWDGDGAWADPNAKYVKSVTYVGSSDGMVIYAVVVDPPGSAEVVAALVLYVDKNGKVNNAGIAKGAF